MPITINGSGLITGDANILGNVSATGSHTLSQVPNYRNTPYIATDYTVSPNYNELSVGPININNGVTVTIADGATWTIV